MVCNIVSTQLDEIWKMTSIFLKTEDDLISLKMGANLVLFFKFEMTSIFLKMEDNLIYSLNSNYKEFI